MKPTVKSDPLFCCVMAVARSTTSNSLANLCKGPESTASPFHRHFAYPLFCCVMAVARSTTPNPPADLVRVQNHTHPLRVCFPSSTKQAWRNVAPVHLSMCFFLRYDTERNTAPKSARSCLLRADFVLNEINFNRTHIVIALDIEHGAAVVAVCRGFDRTHAVIDVDDQSPRRGHVYRHRSETV